MKAFNVKERLSHAREACPGMLEEIYQFVDYLADNLNEEVMPEGVVLAIACTLDDIEKGRSGLGHNFPQYLVDHKKQVLSKAKYSLQIIDKVLNKEFADMVRKGCKEVFNWDPVRRAKFKDRRDTVVRNYPSTMPLVEWWTSLIQLSDKADLRPGVHRVHKEFTAEEIAEFRLSLALDTRIALDRVYVLVLQYDSSLGPDKILRDAFEFANLDSSKRLFILPSHIWMEATETKITVSINHQPEVTVWTAE